MRITIPSVSQPHIVISARAVTDVVNKFIRTSLVVIIGMLSVLGLRESEVTLSGSFELRHLVDAVFG